MSEETVELKSSAVTDEMVFNVLVKQSDEDLVSDECFSLLLAHVFRDKDVRLNFVNAWLKGTAEKLKVQESMQ